MPAAGTGIAARAGWLAQAAVAGQAPLRHGIICCWQATRLQFCRRLAAAGWQAGLAGDLQAPGVIAAVGWRAVLPGSCRREHRRRVYAFDCRRPPAAGFGCRAFAGWPRQGFAGAGVLHYAGGHRPFAGWQAQDSPGIAAGWAFVPGFAGRFTGWAGPGWARAGQRRDLGLAGPGRAPAGPGCAGLAGPGRAPGRAGGPGPAGLGRAVNSHLRRAGLLGSWAGGPAGPGTGRPAGPGGRAAGRWAAGRFVPFAVSFGRPGCRAGLGWTRWLAAVGRAGQAAAIQAGLRQVCRWP